MFVKRIYVIILQCRLRIEYSQLASDLPWDEERKHEERMHADTKKTAKIIRRIGAADRLWTDKLDSSSKKHNFWYFLIHILKLIVEELKRREKQKLHVLVLKIKFVSSHNTDNTA